MATTVRTTDSTATLWNLDPAHTDVGFAVRHMMIATVRGFFPGVEGQIDFDEGRPSEARIAVKIDAASVNTRNEQRDAHLRSADFFDVETHPELAFESRSIEHVSGDRYRVRGDLTIRGVTREVILDTELNGAGTDPWGKRRIGFSATTKVDRRDFGLRWNQALETGGVLVSDEVRINIEGQAVQD